MLVSALAYDAHDLFDLALVSLDSVFLGLWLVEDGIMLLDR
jgi:hypothetical protein